MDSSGKLLDNKEIDASRKLVFPEYLKRKLGSQGFVPGKGNCLSVHWSYEVNSDLLVLSEDPLDMIEYESLVRTSIYQEESKGNTTYKIRVPKSVEDQVSTDISRVDVFHYYAHESMLNGGGDTHSVYLMTERQMRNILPMEDVPDDVEELREAVLNTPGFLPSI